VTTSFWRRTLLRGVC